MSKIKTIIFDLGGVLIDLDFKDSLDAFTKAGFKDIERRVCQFSRDGAFSQYELGLISTEEFRDFIRHEITQPMNDQEIDAMWNKILIDIPHDKLDFILELRKKYTVYLLSNTNELHWIYSCDCMLKHRGLTANDYFDKIFLSFKMHKAKPQSPIFEEMIKETNLVPDEALFIDDSEANCKTASSLGIHTYQYRIGEDISVINSLLK
ncbi:hypothetical protein M9Y10_010378 [Tritrichomonas musculus]|uniref:HAD family phosphatase n=1 Tax=Tritrichomonas musculus TaxID=1915356 RepID=A0ABR2ILE7_9EUKA